MGLLLYMNFFSYFTHYILTVKEISSHMIHVLFNSLNRFAATWCICGPCSSCSICWWCTCVSSQS